MRKNLMIAICSLLLQTAALPAYHAAIVPWMLPETSILPSGAEIARPMQTFAYSMEDVPFYGVSQNLYLTTWSQGNYSGFHWRTATPISGMPLSEGPGMGGEGFVQLTGTSPTFAPLFSTVNDLSTVFLRDPGGDIYIIATFYGVQTSGVSGHYAQIYRWLPSGVSLLSTITLSTSPTYGRISLDAHKMYAVSMVWEAGGILYMKGIYSSTGMAISPTMTVPSPYRGYIPDIAFGHPNSDYLRARVVYVSNTLSRPTVIHIDFLNLMSSTPAFILDDVNLDAFPFPLPVLGGTFASSFSYPLGENLKIDCPDHNNTDDWAYVYTTNQMRVYARGRQGGGPASTISLTGAAPALDAGYYNQQLAIHFNRNGRVYAGWRTNYAMFSPNQRFVGKVFDFSSPAVDYPIICNETYALSSIAFSKQDDLAHCLFASYLYFDIPGIPALGYDLRYKRKPFAAGIQFSEVKEIEDVSIGVYPNPVTDHVNINYNGDPAKLFSLNAVNIMGQSVLSVKGNVVDIQQELNQSLGRLSPGQYVLHFRESEGSFEKSIKLVKQ